MSSAERGTDQGTGEAHVQAKPQEVMSQDQDSGRVQADGAGHLETEEPQGSEPPVSAVSHLPAEHMSLSLTTLNAEP